MSNTTGSTSMVFNNGSRRARTKVQQDFTDRRINSLSIQSDMARLSFTNASGSDVTFPYSTLYGGSGYTNIFTDSSGIVHPYASRLNQRGTLWDVLNGSKQLKYKGDATIAQYYATMTISQNTANKSVWSYTVTGGGGTDYSSGIAPTVIINNSGTGGSGAAATANITAAGALESITVTNPGSCYNTAPAVTFSYGGASADANISAKDVAQIAIYKKSPSDADFTILNSNTIGEVVCNQNTTATGNAAVSFLSSIAKNDIIEARVQVLGGGTLGFKVRNLALSIRPIAMVSGEI